MPVAISFMLQANYFDFLNLVFYLNLEKALVC